MRVHICAVGRLRAGPERDLIDDYLARFGRTGRSLGLGPAKVIEADDRKSNSPESQANLLERAIPQGAVRVMLDERGAQMASTEFADILGGWRDAGRGDVAFVIGGADGIAPALRNTGDLGLSFGAMVWPHMLARVMLAEQLYRSATILSGSPYHRA